VNRQDRPARLPNWHRRDGHNLEARKASRRKHAATNGAPNYEQTPKEWAELFDRLRTAGPNDRILLKGTIVISVDLAIGDFDQGDVLIRGRRIEAVDADLSAVAADGGAIVIEMGGMIVMLGIIDGHRHCWQNQFRRAIPDVDLAE
jgi:hypothetical protein